MAKAPARSTPTPSAPPPAPNRERPAEPTPYAASKEELLQFYHDMLLIRRFEEKAGQLYGMGVIAGFSRKLSDVESDFRRSRTCL